MSIRFFLSKESKGASALAQSQVTDFDMILKRTLNELIYEYLDIKSLSDFCVLAIGNCFLF